MRKDHGGKIKQLCARRVGNDALDSLAVGACPVKWFTDRHIPFGDPLVVRGEFSGKIPLSVDLS
jgi:hypothetical protein